MGVLSQLEWSYNHRDTLAYEGLFADDYQFEFAGTDSSGNAYRNRPFSRDDELCFARAAFIFGTLREPPPATIQLQVAPNTIALPDDRPGKDPSVHKQILADLFLRTEQPDIEVSGAQRFFVVRGDSAVWPGGVAHSGADSTHWFLEMWEELPPQGPSSFVMATSAVGSRGHAPLHTLPSHPSTFGLVKALYQDCK